MDLYFPRAEFGTSSTLENIMNIHCNHGTSSTSWARYSHTQFKISLFWWSKSFLRLGGPSVEVALPTSADQIQPDALILEKRNEYFLSGSSIKYGDEYRQNWHLHRYTHEATGTKTLAVNRQARAERRNVASFCPAVICFFLFRYM